MTKKKRLIVPILIAFMVFATGCGSQKTSQPEAEAPQEETSQEETAPEAEEKESQVASKSEMTEVENVVEDWMEPISVDALNDGTYPITVSSSSSMFKIESGELNVSNGDMTAVMTMGGKGYRYLFMGTGEEASKASDKDFIHYEENSDGAHTYTVPVEALDKGIDCTAFSDKKEKWYDRTLVFRSDSLPLEAFKADVLTTPDKLNLENGEYSVGVKLFGGSGKATVESPATMIVDGDSYKVRITWSSSNYDYMIVNDEKYLPVNTEGNSVFEIPISVLDRPMAVIADTVAMSEPHEISYSLEFDSSTINKL